VAGSDLFQSTLTDSSNMQNKPEKEHRNYTGNEDLIGHFMSEEINTE